MTHQIPIWIAFNLFILSLILLDLGVFQRKAHEIKVKEALLWCLFWMSLAFIFNIGIYVWRGREIALQFTAGYLLEQSLSVDNLFVFLQIFLYFQVPAKYQHKVLFWGILGVIIMRAFFIITGVVLIQKFFWITYVFGAFLIWTGLKMTQEGSKEIEHEKKFLVRLFRRVVPVEHSFASGNFFIKKDGRIFASLLLIVLFVVEISDILFAVDSIPAVLAISKDPFIVYSSNLFAVLGLRSMYFALAGLMGLFHYLKYGLSVILVFIGLKMILEHIFPISIVMSLSVILGVLITSVAISIGYPKKN